MLILALIGGAVGRGQTFTDDFSKPVAPWVSRPGKALTKGSGFFRTLQADGRWWLVDPEGKPFFDIGTDHVSYGGHWCEALGYAPYHRNVAATYGSEAAWGRATLQRLKSWGFNCLPAGHSPSLRHQGLAHIQFASFGAEFARREWITRPVNWTGFPDVFSPRWESHCRSLARNLAQQTRGDPWCIGTFLDNELEWYGKSGQLLDEVFQLGEYYAVVRKPMIITEWSFPALDSGLPCKHGAGMRVDTQEQKAACYRIFANTMAGLPFMIGYHYFMWADQPAQGISRAFPEDSNYGLVNEKDEPYEVFTRTVADVNRRAPERHGQSSFSGLMALTAGPARVEVSNPSALAAYGHLRLTVPGSNRVEEVRLKPGERRGFAMPSDTTWCAELQNWDGSKRRVLGGKPQAGGPTVVNISGQDLARVPVLVEDPELALGFVEKLAPGESLRLNALALKPEPRSQVELKGVDTTWVCSGKTGALFDRIESGGLVLGRLVFAVHQRIKGQDQWVESSRIRRLAMQTEPQAWVVEAEVEYPGASEGPAGYRARVRAVVFRELGLALVRPLWVESLDARDWQLVEVFWFCRPAIGGSPENDVVGGPGVPDYYRAAQFITDTKLGGCFGSLHQPDGWQVMFWTNPQGGIHPDSRLAVDQQMTPNRRWQPAAMPYLWVFGASRTDAWKEFSKLSQQAGQALSLSKPRWPLPRDRYGFQDLRSVLGLPSMRSYMSRHSMQIPLVLPLSFCALAFAAWAGESPSPLPVPTPQQVAWHEAGVGLFFHWAPNVCQGTEGDNRSTPVTIRDLSVFHVNRPVPKLAYREGVHQ